MPSPSSTSSVSVSTSGSPTSTTTTSPELLAQEEARGMVARYYRDAARGLYEPTKTSPSFFEGSSSGTALVDNVNALNAAKAQKIRVTGETKLESVQHVKTDLTMDLKSTPPTVPIVTFLVCYDVTGVDVVDNRGKSIVPASRKPTGLRLVGVVNRDYPSPDGWRVEYVQPKADSC
ncbi:hypothetical protein [Terrabacter sp. NPDC000476]|uniref:hypothetical protein n=1 Tax=Terrabacter sp. NPDC000476 TaxID=3154258 RepID=UPI003332CCF9